MSFSYGTVSGSLSPDGAAGRLFSVAMAGNLTIGAPSNMPEGEPFWHVIDGGPGGLTLSFTGSYDFNGSAPTAPGAGQLISIGFVRIDNVHYEISRTT
jgi:hypothetical protein